MIDLKKYFIKWLGPTNLGYIDYYLRPALKKSWGGAFNGQQFRIHMFEDLHAALKFSAFVESGSYRGVTTEYFAEFGIPVYAVESNLRFYTFARLRLKRFDDRLHLTCADSRHYLHQLAYDRRFPRQRVFFYLDAHWEEDLPLREELEIIYNFWPDAVVMVDDFQVPGTRYAYDDYGEGKVLNVDYLRSLPVLKLWKFYPAVDETHETGAKRGCVILCHNSDIASIIRSIGSVRNV